jgi:DNA adenine methylase
MTKVLSRAIAPPNADQRPHNVPKTAKNAARAQVLRENIRWLLDSEWLSQREAADEIGVRYKWLRRLCHHGLVWPDQRTAEKLDQLAEFFGVRTDDLWSTGLRNQPRLPCHHVLLKWMGSKRKQANEIVSRFPRQINTYYEPFVGSGAVLFRLLSSNIRVERFQCSDLCKPLIDLWNTVIRDPRRLASQYAEMWKRLQSGGKDYYDEVRRRFNESGDPCDFFFLLRTCRIGIVRFNRQGKFMVPFHRGEDGLPPEAVKRLINEWHRLLRAHDVQFTVRDYRTIRPKRGDWLYLDPPYEAGRCRLYFGRFDHRKFFEWLGRQRAGYALSLNGFVGDEDRRMSVPEDLFDEHVLIDNGTSAITRLNGIRSPRMRDSLYLRFVCDDSTALIRA